MRPAAGSSVPLSRMGTLIEPLETRIVMDASFVLFDVDGDHDELGLKDSDRLQAAPDDPAVVANVSFGSPAIILVAPGQPISAPAAAAMSSGTTGFANWLGSLGTYAQFDKALPGIQQSLGSALNMGSTLNTRVAQPIASYLATDTTPTVEELRTVIEGLDTTAGDLVFTSSVSNAGIFGAPGQTELRYDVVFDFQWTRQLGLDVGAALSDGLYLLDANANTGFRMTLNLSLGVDLRAGLPQATAFFIRPSDLRMSFDLHANLNAGVAIGFLGATINGGRMDADADLVLGIANPDADPQQRITLAELQSTPRPSLVTLTGSGGFTADLPFTASLGTWTLIGTPRISLAQSDSFSGLAPQVQFNADAGPALPFRALNAGSFSGLINEIATWSDDWINARRPQASSLDSKVPFAGDRTFDDLLSVGAAIRAKLGELLPNNGTVLPFRTAQELAAKLTQILGSAQINYNAATQELSYGIAFSHTSDPTNIPLNFNFDLSPLASLSSTNTITLTSTVTAGMTLGVTLTPYSATLEGAAVLPGNGHLPSDATFLLGVNGSTPISVLVAADATNANTADLISDVNAALQTAGVSSIVTAGVSAGHLTLTTSRPTLGVSLVVYQANAGAAALGLSTSSNAINTLSDHAWVQNATFTGSVTASATNLQASAELGFLDIEITQGTANASASISASLRSGQNGTPGERVSIRNLLNAVTNDPLSIAAIQIAGSASASLQNIRVVDDFLGVIQGNPTVTVNWPDVTQLSTLQLAFNANMDPLRAFENFAATKIIDLLEDVQKWVLEVEKKSFFTDKLPLINRSPNELLKLSERLADLIKDLREDLPKSIQKLEAKLIEKLGLGGASALSLAPDSGLAAAAATSPKVTFSNKILTIDLKLNKSFTGPVPFDLKADLTSLGLPAAVRDLIALGGSGQLNVAATADGHLVFGFDLNQLLPSLFIRDDSRADLSLKVDAPDLDFQLALGPLGLFVVNGTARLDNGASLPADRQPATLTVTMDTDPIDHRYSFFEAFTKINADLHGYAQTTLPIFFPTVATPVSPALVLTVGDLAHPIASSTLNGPNLGAFLNNLSITSNLEALRQGWSEILGLVETLLKANVFGSKFPLVGDHLDDALDFIARMRTQLQTNLGLLQSFTVTTVQQALFASLGPPGLKWLQDRPNDSDTVVTASDIEIQTDGVNYVQFNMVLAEQRDLLKADLDFDLGLPALGLSLDGAVAVGGGFRWDLRFGVSKTEGVYLDTAAVTGAEFQVNFGATIPNFSAVGRLGFLEVRAKDDSANPSTFGGTFNVNFTTPNVQSGRLRLADLQANLASWDQAIDVSLTAAADLNLKVSAGFSEIGVLPSLEADFNLDWIFTSTDADLKGGVPSIAFNNVRLNLGSFFSSFAGPLLGRVQEVLRPIQPVIDALNQRVPVYSDLLGEDVTFFELAERFGDPGQVRFVEFIDSLADIVTLINSVPVIQGNQYIQLGSFNLLGTDVRAIDNVGSVNPNQTVTTDPVSQLTGDAATFFNRTQDVGNRAMSFPLLQHPLQAFRLLLGQDVNLFLYDMAPLEIGFDAVFGYFPVAPPLPIFVELGGGIGAKLDLAFGYDTSGLREFARTGYISDVFDGFYVSDRLNADGTGADVPEVQLWANVYAALEVNVAILWAGIEGGITANVNLNLKDLDNDGKVHAEEFLQTFDGNLLSTFDVSGAIEAYLKWYVRAGFKAFGTEVVLWQAEDEIAHVTLANFKTPPSNPIWDGGGDGTSWTDARNWQGDTLPTSSKNVIINVPGKDVTVVLPANVSAASISSKETLVLNSTILDAPKIDARQLIVTDLGRLTTARNLDVDRFDLAAGGTLTIKNGGNVTVSQLANLSGILDAQGGNFTAVGGDVDHNEDRSGDGDGAAFVGNVARVFASAGAKVAIDASSYTSTGLTRSGIIHNLITVTGAGTVLDLSAMTNFNAGFDDGTGTATAHAVTVNAGARINLSGLTKITGPARVEDWFEIVMDGGTSRIDLPNLQTIVGEPTRFSLSGSAALELPSLQSASNTQFYLSGGARLTAAGPNPLLYSSTGLTTATLFSASGAGTTLDLAALKEINAGFNDGSSTSRAQTITASAGARINLSGLTKITGPARAEDRIDVAVSSGAQLNLAGAITGSSIFTLSDPNSIFDVANVTSLTRITLTAANGATWNLPAGWNPNIGASVALTTTGVGSRFVSQASLNLTGATLTINPLLSVTDGSAFANHGILGALTGGTIDLNGSFRVDNSGILAGVSGGSFNIAGNLLGDTRNADLYAPAGTVRFDGTGTVASPQLLEAMSQDLGAVAAGFSRNFAYNILSVAANTRVQLVNQSDNAAGVGAEAVYTDTVIVPAGATLDLNNLHLYARTMQVGANSVVGGTITIIPDLGLLVASISGDPSGVAVRFSKPIDPTVLNLYATQTGGQGPLDVTLTGAASGSVTGSLVLDADNAGFRFLKTGNPLPADTYTLTLISATNGFKDRTGILLDGNQDGTAGGDYVQTFNVTASGALLSIPDIARGPGQPVNLPASGLPVTLSNGVGTTKVDFTLAYNPMLLAVTGVTLGATAPAGSTVTTDFSQTGRIIMTVNLGAALTSAAALELVRIQAKVPETATALYGQRTVLDLTDVTLNQGALAVRADDGVLVGAYVGDASGNKSYETLDVQQMQRVVARLDSGFAAYPLLDPAILGDVTGNGIFNTLDVQRLQQRFVPLLVTSAISDASGAAVRFNKPLDPEALNLYATATGGQGAADVTLTGSTTGAVAGSLVLDADNAGFRFVKTGNPLATDTYTLTLRSAADGFKDRDGILLDGNADGTAGGNYVQTFNIAASGALLSMPDIARGPGQPVNQPASGSGLPVTLTNAAGSSRVDFTLAYNPTLLTVTSVTLGAGAPAGSTVTTDLTQAGQVMVTVNLGATLTSAAALELVRIQSEVPTTAQTSYTKGAVLDLKNVTLNQGALAVRADDGILVNAYVGDTDGNKGYDTLDVQQLQRVVARLDGGFAAYPLLDPAVLGDTTGNGSLNSLDAQRLQQKIAGLPQTSIPPIPALLPPSPALSSAEPLVQPDTAPVKASAEPTPIGVVQIAALKSVLSPTSDTTKLATLIDSRHHMATSYAQEGADQKVPKAVAIKLPSVEPLSKIGPVWLSKLDFTASKPAPRSDVAIGTRWAAFDQSWLTLNEVAGADESDDPMQVHKTRWTPAKMPPWVTATAFSARAHGAGKH